MLDQTTYAFEGKRHLAKNFVRSLPDGTFYTYLLLTPSGTPFYVGKGKGDRMLHHEAEALRNTAIHKTNPFKCNKIRQISNLGQSVMYRVDRLFGCDEISCLKWEEKLISFYKRRCDGGSLTNLAAGLGSLSARDPLTRDRHATTLAGVPPPRMARSLPALERMMSVPSPVVIVSLKLPEVMSKFSTPAKVAMPSPERFPA